MVSIFKKLESKPTVYMMHTPPLVEQFDGAMEVINEVYPQLMPQMAQEMDVKLIDIFNPLC